MYDTAECRSVLVMINTVGLRLWLDDVGREGGIIENTEIY